MQNGIYPDKIRANIFEIKKFAVHDGPGVRTTLFFKGCPLKCRWCHNPESISPKPQLAYYEHKCINCGECVSICPNNAHSMADGKHEFDRNLCIACGKCEEVCLGDSLRLYGKEISIEEAMELVLEDRGFYGEDGGVTLSGGEPLTQADFCHELLKKLKKEGINTAVDTCACVNWSAIEKVLPFTDLFLVDFKHSDSAMHRELTGQGNELIIANLKRLSESGAKIEVRIPLIPGYNNSQSNLKATAKILEKMKLERVKILPYHDMAQNKYKALNIPNSMGAIKPSDPKDLSKAMEILNEY